MNTPKINNIIHIKNSKMRLFPFQPKDPFFVLQNDYITWFLISLLVDKIWFSLNQISVSYVYSFSSYFDYFVNKVSLFEEDYFIFTLENYYHSNEYSYQFLLQVLEYFKQHNITKKIIVHTLKTSDTHIDYLLSHFDNVLLVVNTDLEYFFNEFYFKNIPISNIPNLYFKDDDGKIYKNIEENVDYNLSEYMLGAYYNGYLRQYPKSQDEIISLKVKEKRKKYNDNILYLWSDSKYISYLRNTKNDSAMMMTWKWCRFHCSYCFRWTRYKTVRQFPINIIKKDLDMLSKLGYKTIDFFDDCFISTNLNRLDEVKEMLGEYDFSYKIDVRYELLTPLIFEKLKDINFSSIKIGLQSSSIATNQEIKRSFDFSRFKQTIKEMKEKEISIYIDLILWLPWESLSDFIKTLHFTLSLQPSKIFVNKLYLNPKTDLENKKNIYNIVTEHDVWEIQDFYVPKIVSSNTFSYEDILFAQKYITTIINKYNIDIILR